MIIKSKMSEKDYINVNFLLLYSKLSIKIMSGFLILYLIGTTISSVISGQFSATTFTPLAVMAVMPVMTYFSAKKNYKYNQRIGETIEYNFGEEDLIIKGESFTSQLSWQKIHKVTGTKNWLFIWQNRQVANPISRVDVWEGEISDLKTILKKYNIKNNL